MSQLALISVFSKGPKTKWLSRSESSAAPDDSNRPFVWAGLYASSQLAVAPEDWYWPAKSPHQQGSGPSLLNMCSAWTYRELIRRVKITNRGRFALSWMLSEAQQAGSLKIMWRSAGVAPKTAALAWRTSKRALPNADPRTGFLKLFEVDSCPTCAGNPRRNSEHIFYGCESAQAVWRTIDTWIAGHESRGGRRIDAPATLHGIDGSSADGRPFRELQWWAMLWTATIFELWKSWSGHVHSGKEPRPRGREALLCAIWERWVISSWALEQRRGSVFKAKHWCAVGTKGGNNHS